MSEPHGDRYFIKTQNQQPSVSLFHLVFIFALKNALKKNVSKLNMRESMVYFCNCRFTINAEFEIQLNILYFLLEFFILPDNHLTTERELV